MAWRFWRHREVWKLNCSDLDAVGHVRHALMANKLIATPHPPLGLGNKFLSDQKHLWRDLVGWRPSRIRVSDPHGRPTRGPAGQLLDIPTPMEGPRDLFDMDISAGATPSETYLTLMALADWWPPRQVLAEVSSTLGPALVAARWRIRPVRGPVTIPRQHGAPRQVELGSTKAEGRTPEERLPVENEILSLVWHHRSTTILAPAVVLGIAVAPVASAATLAALQRLSSWQAVLIGVAAAVATGLAILLMLAFGATAWRVNGRQYGELTGRLRSVQARANVVGEGCIGKRGLAAARLHSSALQDALHRRSMQWISSTGYVNAWSELHRAEESLILFTDKESVASWGREDQMRLTASGIPNSEQLIARLRLCVSALGVTTPQAKAQGQGTPAGQDGPRGEAAARAELMQLRYAINSYRDGIWEKLVNAKNLLLAKIATVWLLAYLTLVVLALADAKPTSLVTAALFFAVGALVGAIGDLSQQNLAQSAEEDYGLGRARLIASMLISGVAALFGVALTAILGVSILGQSLASAATSGRAASWSQVFDWHLNLVGFVAAAAFGFAPSRLFDLLRRDQTDAVQKIEKSRSMGNTS